MNVLVDKARMVVLRKMDSLPVLSKLCDIECPHIPTSIYCADSPRDFDLMTDLELKLLIKNTQGPDVSNVFAKDALQRILFSVLQALPETKVNGFEVDMQWRAIARDDERRYQFVPGANKPALVQDGVGELAALQCPADAAGRAASAANARGATAPAPSNGAAAVARPSASSDAEDFTPPRPGTSTHTIFTFCATKWKEQGYPDNKNALDGIRKEAVDKLVPTGLNVSTVRTQAARWYQHRQRFVV